jgi:hypothetical protein
LVQRSIVMLQCDRIIAAMQTKELRLASGMPRLRLDH